MFRQFKSGIFDPTHWQRLENAKQQELLDRDIMLTQKQSAEALIAVRETVNDRLRFYNAITCRLVHQNWLRKHRKRSVGKYYYSPDLVPSSSQSDAH